jgi:hypothetical protein
VVLEIDDHGPSFGYFAGFLAHVPAFVIGGEGTGRVSLALEAG